MKILHIAQKFNSIFQRLIIQNIIQTQLLKVSEVKQKVCPLKVITKYFFRKNNLRNFDLLLNLLQCLELNENAFKTTEIKIR